MKLTIKRIDKSLPLPEYQTAGAAAFDLYAREETIILPMKPALIPTNLIIKIPQGHFLMLASRSSTPIKKGLMVANGIGVIDEDYCGDEDEIKLQMLNFTDSDIVVEKGERIGQALLIQISKASEFIEVEKMDEKSRGGFGTTG